MTTDTKVFTLLAVFICIAGTGSSIHTAGYEITGGIAFLASLPFLLRAIYLVAKDTLGM